MFVSRFVPVAAIGLAAVTVGGVRAAAELDAKQYITTPEASQFLGKPAHVLRESHRGGAYPISTCLYTADTGFSLQVVVQSNVSPASFHASIPKHAQSVPGVGEAAWFTKDGTDGVLGNQFDTLKKGLKLHLYTRRVTSAEEMKVLALKALSRVP